MRNRQISKRSSLYMEDFNENLSVEEFFKNYNSMTLEDLQEELNEEIDDLQDDMGPKGKKSKKDIDKAQKQLNSEFEKLIEEVGEDTKISDIIPGSDMMLSEFMNEDEDDSEKTYEEHKHLPDFLRYVQFQYPDKLPKHNGQSMLGCERAIAWLQRLSNEISTNIRNDVEGCLSDDIDTFSDIQENILTDIIVLKKHMKKLRDMLPEKAETRMASVEDSIEKFASTPNNMVITVTPFIRAITGILVNSTVSAGKPFEDVYDYLIEKYEISEREQLEVLQVLMDMGQPIFKDRGTMPGSKESKETEEAESNLKGVDFITNYFG